MHIPDPSRQRQHLVKHFFWRFFDLEAISAPQVDPVQKNALKIRILASMVFPGVAACMLLCPKYAMLKYHRPAIEFQQAMITDKIFFLSLSMILLGFVAVYEWETLLPDRKDYLILTHLPIQTGTIFSAKMAALVLFLLAFIVAVNACPAVLLPNAILVDNAPFFYGLRYMACHAVAFLLGNALIFLATIALQGILLMLLPSGIAVSISRKIRFVCLMLLLFALFSFPAVRSVGQSVPGFGPIAPFYPPIWFVGVYDVLLGSRDPILMSLAGRAVVALLWTGALCALTYAVCYRRFVNTSLETESGGPRKKACLRGAGNFLLDRCVPGKPEDRAAFHFVGQTFFRSPQHILYWGIFLALGISVSSMVVISALHMHVHNAAEAAQRDEMFLLAPRLLVLILLAGVKVSFAIPVDLDANWLFRLTHTRQIRRQLRGFRIWVIGMCILPVFMISGLFYLSIWDWHRVLRHSCYGVALSLIVMELFFLRFEKIPFTCSYLPGGAQRVLFWPLYMIGFAVYMFAATKAEAWLPTGGRGPLYFYATIVAIWAVLLYQNIFAGASTVNFEQESSEDPTYLNMRS